jgi:hypothetical protein
MGLQCFSENILHFVKTLLLSFNNTTYLHSVVGHRKFCITHCLVFLMYVSSGRPIVE